MLLVKLLVWKLRAAKLRFIVKSYDMRNTFGTGTHEGLMEVVRSRGVRWEQLSLFEQHREQGVIVVEAADATIGLRPRSGGRMGDSNEPELFMGAFYPRVEEWNGDIKLLLGDHFAARSPLDEDGDMVSLGMGGFVDDLVRVMIIPDGKVRTTQLIDHYDNKYLDEALARGGYKQNVRKQDTLVHLSTRQATKEAERRIGGTPVVDMIHLGGYVNVNGSNTREVHERIVSGNVGWSRTRGYWTSEGPWRAKRVAFLANVVGRIWSGMESFVLRPSEYRALDRSMA